MHIGSGQQKSSERGRLLGCRWTFSDSTKQKRATRDAPRKKQFTFFFSQSNSCTLEETRALRKFGVNSRVQDDGLRENWCDGRHPDGHHRRCTWDVEQFEPREISGRATIYCPVCDRIDFSGGPVPGRNVFDTLTLSFLAVGAVCNRVASGNSFLPARPSKVVVR